MPQTAVFHRNFTAKLHSSHHFFSPPFSLTHSIHTCHPINTLSSPRLHLTSLPSPHLRHCTQHPFLSQLISPFTSSFSPIFSSPIPHHETYPTQPQNLPNPRHTQRFKSSTSLTTPFFFTDRRFYVFTLLRFHRKWQTKGSHHQRTISLLKIPPKNNTSPILLYKQRSKRHPNLLPNHAHRQINLSSKGSAVQGVTNNFTPKILTHTKNTQEDKKRGLFLTNKPLQKIIEIIFEILNKFL